MKRWLLPILLLLPQMLSPLRLPAREERNSQEHYRKEIYQAYLDSRMDRWKMVMEEMEAEYRRDPDNGLLYEMCEAYYGYIPWCISVKKKQEAERLLGRAEELIEILLQKESGNARATSLRGAFYGFRVGLEPLKAPFYGRKSYEANEKALELDPEEPQAWMEKANIAFYKPAIFGGSDREAVPLYEKAVRLFESIPGRTENNWIYLNCLAGFGIACEETGEITRAGEVYRKLLRLEPTFKWVRDELYPEYLQKHFSR